MNKTKLSAWASALSSALLVAGCATTGTGNYEEASKLKPGYARIQFQASNHIPHLFQEKLYGLISQLYTADGDSIDIDPTGESRSIRYVDVLPGSYKLSANCDPVNNHSGDQYNWLVNHTLEVQANQIATLACEYYDKEVTRSGNEEDKKTVRRVKIVHQDTEFVN